MTENLAARGLAGLAAWLREQSEELMKSAIARESTAETMRAATPQELREAKALAEKMAGRKLPNVSTGSEEAKIEADVQCRIAAKLDSKARQIAIWADELAATRKTLQFYADPQTYGLHGGGVERILNDSGKRARTALEAAAPPGTAPRHELRTEILRVYVALHFDPEEHGWPRVAGVYSTYEAAESRVEELGCGATQSLHLNKPVRLAVPAATQEQPAGSAPQWNIEQILVYIWQCIGGEDSDPKEYPYSQFAESEGGKLLRSQLEGLARLTPQGGRGRAA